MWAINWCRTTTKSIRCRPSIATVASVLMKSPEQRDPRLAQFRESLRLQSARRAFDVLLEYAPDLTGYRFEPAADKSLNEIHYLDSASGSLPFSLAVTEGELLFDVHAAGFGRVPGGLPALDAGLGPVSETDTGVWRVRILRPAQADALSRLLFSRHEPRRTRSRHWWANLPHGEHSEIEDNYLWAAKQPTAGSRKQSRQAITCIVSGDVVFAHVDGMIAAIGVVLDRARSAPDPRLTGSDGWLVSVRFVKLNEPLPIKDQLPVLRRERASKQSLDVYLAEVPESGAQALRRRLSRLVEDLEERIASETDGKLLEQAIEEHIWQRTNITPLEKRQLSFARLGQGAFRENVERIETACRVTGILDRRYLRATHIKPWREATDRERLDGSNGLLLSPHIIHLFDRGHISFADDGKLIISRHLNPYVRKAWNLERPVQPRPFRTEQRAYLSYHRAHVFERVGGGRRSPGDSA
jgi:putative restriction endonuclease